MKSILNIQKYEFAHYTKNKNEGNGNRIPYIRLNGLDSDNSPVTTLLYGSVAEVLNRELDEALPEGQDLKDSALFVEIRGELVEFKPNGDPVRNPYLRGREFTLLKGPALEVRQAKLALEKAMENAASLAEESNFESAYAVLKATSEQIVNSYQKPDQSHNMSPPQETQRIEKAASPKGQSPDTQSVSSTEEKPTVISESVATSPEESAMSKLDGNKVFSDTPDPEVAAARKIGLNTEAEKDNNLEEKSTKENTKELSAKTEDPFASSSGDNAPNATNSKSSNEGTSKTKKRVSGTPFSPFSPF